METVVQRAVPGRVSVIDVVPPPVVEEAQRAGCPSVVVFDGHGSHAARDALVDIKQGCGRFSRL